MAFLRSALYALVFYFGTVFAVLLSFPVSLLGTKAVRTWAHGWCRFHRWCAWLILGIRSRIEGPLPRGACLVAVKHQSMFETIEMLRLADTPVVVLKRELSAIPVFGWMTRRYGVIPVDRDAGAKALREMLAQGRAAREAGRPVVIFPEGTRVPPGETPPLRPGFAGLYRALGLDVVPIALDSGRLWGRGLVKRRGVVTVRVGETIPTGLPRDEVEARVHSAINALERLAP